MNVAVATSLATTGPEITGVTMHSVPGWVGDDHCITAEIEGREGRGGYLLFHQRHCRLERSCPAAQPLLPRMLLLKEGFADVQQTGGH